MILNKNVFVCFFTWQMSTKMLEVVGRGSGGENNQLESSNLYPNDPNYPNYNIYRVLIRNSIYSWDSYNSLDKSNSHYSSDSIDSKYECARKGILYTFSHTIMCSLKNIEKEKLHIHQQCFCNQIITFVRECIHCLKTSNFGPQGPQNAELQQRYSICYSEKPNFSGGIENTFFKNPNFDPKFFS